MAQITTGIRSLLSSPWIYGLSQTILGCRKERKEIATAYLRPEAGFRVLDIGCGTAEIIEYLPEVDYFGIDLSQRYIRAAERRYGGTGVFSCVPLEEFVLAESEPFDLVISLGVLHHLDDEEVIHLFLKANSVLRPGGRIVTMDPAFVENQSLFAKTLMRLDRGKNIRTPNEYLNLCKNVFDEADVSVRHDLMTVPYSRAILQGRRPSNEENAYSSKAYANSSSASLEIQAHKALHTD
jgi:SAM-dependent methyltransferase